MCKNKIQTVEPTDLNTLNHYVSYFGMIEPRVKTRLCQKHQKIITKAIKKARDLGLKVGE